MQAPLPACPPALLVLAAQVGEYLVQRLRALVPQHECVGDVRGMGLMVGIDIVRDKASKKYAPATAK